MPGVESIVPIMKPYKLASKELKQEPTIVEVGDVRIGGNEVVVMAGPCAIETKKFMSKQPKRLKRQEPKYSAAVLSSPVHLLILSKVWKKKASK